MISGIREKFLIRGKSQPNGCNGGEARSAGNWNSIEGVILTAVRLLCVTSRKIFPDSTQFSNGFLYDEQARKEGRHM
jgi:hypothetical protein